jgi:hypothetical protein
VAQQDDRDIFSAAFVSLFFALMSRLIILNMENSSNIPCRFRDVSIERRLIGPRFGFGVGIRDEVFGGFSGGSDSVQYPGSGSCTNLDSPRQRKVEQSCQLVS